MNAHVCPPDLADGVRQLMALGIRFPLHVRGAATYDADGDSLDVTVHREGTGTSRIVAERKARILNQIYQSLAAPKSYAALEAGFASAEAV